MEDPKNIYIINIVKISHFIAVSALASGLRSLYFVHIQVNTNFTFCWPCIL